MGADSRTTDGAGDEWEYRTTSGPRKAFDEAPPEGDGWERDTSRGEDGWERFDHHEEAYWKRKRPKPETKEVGN